MTTITRIRTVDARYQLKPGEGADAVHTDPVYSYPVTLLKCDDGLRGVGIAMTLGGGNDLVCRLVEELAHPLVGAEIEALMADFGAVFRRIADDPQYRWLGPHKGMVHLALACITTALAADLFVHGLELAGPEFSQAGLVSALNQETDNAK